MPVASSEMVSFTPAGVAVISTMLAALTGAISLLFKNLMDAHAADIRERDAQNDLLLKEKDTLNEALARERDAFRSMTISAITNLEIAADFVQKTKGGPVTEKVAPVIPESNSPPTQKQIEDADAATLRARLTAASLALNLPGRPTHEVPSTETADAVRGSIDDYLKGHNPRPSDQLLAAADAAMHEKPAPSEVVVINPPDKPVPTALVAVHKPDNPPAPTEVVIVNKPDDPGNVRVSPDS